MISPLKLLSLVALVAATSLASRAETLPLKLDREHSSIEVAVHATGDSFVGKLERYEAEIGVDSGSGEPCAAQFKFLFINLKTGKEGRDTKMLSWQENSRFPEGVFKLASLSPAPEGGFLAKGVLTLHGQEKPIEFPLRVTKLPKQLELDGEATIDTRDFGLPIIRMLGLFKVDPLVKIHFHLRGSHD